MSPRLFSQLALVVGLTLLYFQSSLLDLFFPPRAAPEPNLELARIEAVQGEVWLSRKNGERRKLQADDELKHMDRIDTTLHSYADVHFSKGYTLRFLGDSSAFFEKGRKPSETLLTLIQGQYQILDPGASGSLLEIRGTALVPPAQRLRPNPPSLKRVPPTKPPAASPQTQRPTLAPKGPNAQLKTQEIQKVMGAQTFWFNKCYANYIKDNPKGQGDISVVFDIHPSGEVRQAKILKSTLPDETLEKCVLQTVKRSRFTRFQGEPRKIVFPIHFGGNSDKM